ncbi:sugar phosphate isomerase/epimerase [bacterium]|nr:sugar phosphate isomerase/epimerase [bacterium]
MTRFKKAICNDAFKNWEIADVFKYVGDLGYDGVEINPYTLCETLDGFSSAAQLSVREAAESAGVEIIGIHSILKNPKRFFHINHPDASIRAETLEHLNALITFCGDLGGKVIPLGASKQRTVLPDLTHQQAWDYAIAVFREALKTAERRGVVLCLEPLTHRLTNFITKASEATRMVEEMDHPNFKMMIDVRSASDDEMPIPELIRQSAHHLAHFHANDDNGRGPGKGNADYAGISDALKEIGYEGYLSVEVFDFQPDPETIAIESLNTLRKYFD